MTTDVRDFVVAQKTGRSLIEEDDIDSFRAELDALLESAPGAHVLIDFTGLESLSSRALGVLVAKRKEARAAGSRMVLHGFESEAIKRVMDATRLHTLFPIASDRDNALRLLQTEPRHPFWSGPIDPSPEPDGEG